MKLKKIAIALMLIPTILLGGFFDSPSSYSRTLNHVFSKANHRLARMSDHGDVIEIEDSSIWRIEPHHWHIVRDWKIDDPITVTQNTAWFSNAPYRVVNLVNNDAVEASLKYGPEKDGPYTRYIRTIDWETYQVGLNDGSNWEMASWDFLWISRNWALNDCIIIGINSGWDHSAPGILIDVNLNKFVRARQL